jgi:uncharacterized protein (TIRG00374 family)
VASGGRIRRYNWKWFAGVLIAALLLGWLLARALNAGGFDWRLAAFSFTHLRLQWVVLAVLTVYAAHAGRALRWAVFLRPLKPNPSLRNIFSATVIGFTAVTILGRPGEFVRPYLIALKEKVPLASQLAAWVLERLFDLLMVLVLFGFALARVRSSGAAVGPKLAWVMTAGGRVVAVAALALLCMLVFFRRFAPSARRWVRPVLRFLPEAQLIRLEELVGTFVQGVESTRSDGTLLLVLVYSILEWVLIAAAYWCVASSFADITLTLVDVLILLGFVSMGAAIQIPGIGGGVQVAGVLVLTELFRVRLEPATAFAFLTWLLTFVAVVPAGIVVGIWEGLDWRKLRRLNPGAAQ